MKTFPIFHLKRRSGSQEFFLPFEKKTLSLDAWKTLHFKGSYGSEPRPESTTELREKLYAALEESLLSWHSEQQFIPRFLGATGIFFLLYFFTTYVLRLPIHFAFKLLVSLGLSIGFYFFLGRWDSKATAVAVQRELLREKIDQTPFERDPRLLDLEAKLDTLDNQDRETLCQVIVNPEGHGDPDWAFAQDALGYPWRQILAEVQQRRKAWSLLTPDKAADALEIWARKKKIDPALLALAVVIEKSAKEKSHS